ncbi:MAG: flagellar filament capping protein FliD [Synergistaceae bacterium]|jgi:flagellar hook-associated protein 2|nr:flagellar filament capping protein FliD [Synergistaceae bacterium]
MSDSLFQVSGVSSGIAWDEIISKIVETGKKPATQWQNQIDTLEVKKTLYQELQSEFNKLRNTLTKLRLASAYKSKKAEYTSYSVNNVDPQNIVTAKISDSAELTWWDIEVKELARGQRHTSARVDNLSEALNISGSFRIRVGKQYATIDIKAEDTLRDINYNISKAVDQNGEPIAVTAKILDNRIVLESANTGKGNSGDTRGVDFTMTDAKEYFLPHSSARDKTTGKYVYPPQIFDLYYEDANVDGTTHKYEYKEGTDFTYDSKTGKITWLDTGNRPPKGVAFNAIYSEWLNGSRNESAGPLMDYLPVLPTGADYQDLTMGNFVIISGGVEYKQDLDFFIEDVAGKKVIRWNNSNIGGLVTDIYNPGGPQYELKPPPAAGAFYTIRIGANTGYTYDENVFYMEPTDDSAANYGANSTLAKLGFITPGISNDTWEFTAGSYRNASDAVFEIDGVEVTRSTNTIDDIIANVTLELKGLGQVRVNVVRDLTETAENLQTFVDSYNAVMEWINYYVSQKQDAANQVDETDHLSSILQESKGNTVFGVLHSDQLLWSIKNQLRSRISNPITTLSGALTSRKVVHPASAMNIRSSFNVYVGGKVARIDVTPDDTMEDIQKKLQDAQNIGSSDGKTATKGSLELSVSIRDGQLVIEGSKTTTVSSSTNNMDTISSTLIRSSTADAYDYLAFIPVTSSPVSGSLKVSSGSTIYEEGVDYRIVTQTDDKGVMSSGIEWLSNKAPKANRSFNVEYTYYANAVSFVQIDGTGPSSSEIGKGIYDLSFLELHQSSSKLALMNLGITTESNDYGKSGYIEFDSEKFIEQMESDPDISGNAMLVFMRDMDIYIGNLVDSSQTLVAGQIVTKGRIAGALNSIDSEQTTLNERITKLERQLEEKQTALYKQYSDMEVAIQKLNAQMSSLSNYLNNLNNQ